MTKSTRQTKFLTGNTEGAERIRDDSIVLVEPGQMTAFRKRLDALNKKAIAFGLEPIRIISTEEVIYQRRYEQTGRDYDTTVVSLVPVRKGAVINAPVLLNRVHIEYPEVKLGNWRVIGKLEAIEDGNLTFSISRDPANVAVLIDRADHPIECEHCKTKRIRNDGFVLRDNESGNYKQVGSNCLEDFTGINPAAALFMARMYDVVRLADSDLDEYASSGRVNAVDTRLYLADVSFLTNQGGFISAAKAQDTGLPPTYNKAVNIRRVLRDDAILPQAI